MRERGREGDSGRRRRNQCQARSSFSPCTHRRGEEGAAAALLLDGGEDEERWHRRTPEVNKESIAVGETWRG